MNCDKVTTEIVNWLKNYNKGFVVGVSGGIDSALVSTLCAKTGNRTICVSMPIHQPITHLNRANEHIDWLKSKYNNIESFEVDLTNTFETLKTNMPKEASSDLAMVNARSRLRMITLYNFSNSYGYLVVGTGNLIEDYGIGFYTKYGDGGVDISPIGDLTKTEVRELSKHLGVCNSILIAKPTDGLWNDDRSDEDQIGASYEELEWAMTSYEIYKKYTIEQYNNIFKNHLSARQKEVLQIYIERHVNSRHKMEMPPVCKLFTK